ncbi:hypothetical protein D030_1491 [Vibrio parahaemolyticus AQ3810]|nr:hypothetical protein D030_1491 [Vibrio parahaemolyticus AQ3810]EXJ29887.1 hypothetical protein D048_1335 [Vibrio parahaemolyticus VPTS-2009]
MIPLNLFVNELFILKLNQIYMRVLFVGKEHEVMSRGIGI